MSAVCVGPGIFIACSNSPQLTRLDSAHRSVYQDVPLYSLEEYTRLAPEESRTEQILTDEHQLMLNRLAFELTERQRFPFLIYLLLLRI